MRESSLCFGHIWNSWSFQTLGVIFILKFNILTLGPMLMPSFSPAHWDKYLINMKILVQITRSMVKKQRITCGYSKGIWNFRAIGQFFTRIVTFRWRDPRGIIHDIECYIMIHPNEVKRASNLIRFLSSKYRQPISHHLFHWQRVITKDNRV